jgi:hypothetical protein
MFPVVRLIRDIPFRILHTHVVGTHYLFVASDYELVSSSPWIDLCCLGWWPFSSTCTMQEFKILDITVSLTFDDSLDTCVD